MGGVFFLIAGGASAVMRRADVKKIGVPETFSPYRSYYQ
jgi:hypothetical protein